MSDSGPRLGRAMTYIEKANKLGGFAESFVAGAGGLVMAAFAIIIGIGEAFASLITTPVTAFGDVSGLLIRAGFGSPARFLQDAWNTAAIALGMDPWLSLGPFVIVVAVLAVLAAIFPLAWYLDVVNADTLTGVDLPVVNLDQGGDTDDEQ